jgi:hypothetical protein
MRLLPLASLSDIRQKAKRCNIFSEKVGQDDLIIGSKPASYKHQAMNT